MYKYDIYKEQFFFNGKIQELNTMCLTFNKFSFKDRIIQGMRWNTLYKKTYVLQNIIFCRIMPEIIFFLVMLGEN